MITVTSPHGCEAVLVRVSLKVAGSQRGQLSVPNGWLR